MRINGVNNEIFYGRPGKKIIITLSNFMNFCKKFNGLLMSSWKNNR